MSWGRDEAPPALRPRAIAAMVCLRGGAITTRAMRSRIGDRWLSDTFDLLKDLRALCLIEGPMDLAVWQLTDDGRQWLREMGVE